MPTYYINSGSGSPNTGTYRGIWQNSQTWAVGDRVAPTRAYATVAARKYIYECTTGGAGDASEPTWVYTTPDTSTTTSSSAVFTCREIDDWTNAGVYFHQAMLRAASNGDVIKIHYTTQDELDTDLTFALLAHDIVIISVDKDNSDAYTAMGTGGWIGNSTTARTTGINGAYRATVHGLTWRMAGSANQSFVLGGSGGQFTLWDDCYFWIGTSGSSSTASITSNNPNTVRVRLKDCIFRFANAAHYINLGGVTVHMENCSVSSAGTTPTNLMKATGNGPFFLEAVGCDFSNVGTSVIPNTTGGTFRGIFRQCKLPSTLVSAQTTNVTPVQIELWAFDCSTADTHYEMIYNNGIGELTVSTSFYVTSDGAEYDASANKCSWKIVTGANVSFQSPFITPWISVYNDVVSPTTISPYLEALSGTSGLNESELWAEFAYKTTAGYATATIDYTDGGGYRAASTSDQGSSSLAETDWTETGTNYTYKLAPSGALTVDEIGDLSARVVVAKASTTVYIDPQIRGL